MRSHDHDNLYILGGGAFNSTSALNPTHTIAALALKALDDPRLDI
jgi:choline dehydrogenase-like flavoprotein